LHEGDLWISSWRMHSLPARSAPGTAALHAQPARQGSAAPRQTLRVARSRAPLLGGAPHLGRGGLRRHLLHGLSLCAASSARTTTSRRRAFGSQDLRPQAPRPDHARAPRTRAPSTSTS
jgi:hypothetical protein